MSVLFDEEKEFVSGKLENGEVVEEEEEAPKKKGLPWQRNLKKGKKSAANKKTTAGKKVKPQSKKEMDDKKESELKKRKVSGKSEGKAKEDKEDNNSASGSEDEDDEEMEREEDEEADKSNNDSSEPEKDDDQLEKLQRDVALRRQRLLEGKSQISHSVHCPYYPLDKQEYWWVYISDRKQQLLLTAPYHVTNLVESEEIQLKFTAPLKPGNYTFAACMRSDSFFGFDQTKDIKVTQLNLKLTRFKIIYHFYLLSIVLLFIIYKLILLYYLFLLLSNSIQPYQLNYVFIASVYTLNIRLTITYYMLNITYWYYFFFSHTYPNLFAAP